MVEFPKITAFTPIEAGAIGAGVGLAVGAVAGVAVARSSSKKTRKRRKSKSRNSRKRNYRSKRTRKTPRTAGKGKDTSKRRIRYTKKGQPYKIMANGRARFISKRSASSSHKRKGGAY